MECRNFYNYDIHTYQSNAENTTLLKDTKDIEDNSNQKSKKASNEYWQLETDLQLLGMQEGYRGSDKEKDDGIFQRKFHPSRRTTWYSGRRHHSTVTAKSIHEEACRRSLDKIKLGIIISKDLTAAIDTVNDWILMKKLKYYGLKG